MMMRENHVIYRKRRNADAREFLKRTGSAIHEDGGVLTLNDQKGVVARGITQSRAGTQENDASHFISQRSR
jgi:hypothetical protein